MSAKNLTFDIVICYEESDNQKCLVLASLKALTAILAPLVTLPSFTRKSNFNIAVSLS